MNLVAQRHTRRGKDARTLKSSGIEVLGDESLNLRMQRLEGSRHQQRDDEEEGNVPENRQRREAGKEQRQHGHAERVADEEAGDEWNVHERAIADGLTIKWAGAQQRETYTGRKQCREQVEDELRIEQRRSSCLQGWQHEQS